MTTEARADALLFVTLRPDATPAAITDDRELRPYDFTTPHATEPFPLTLKAGSLTSSSTLSDSTPHRRMTKAQSICRRNSSAPANDTERTFRRTRRSSEVNGLVTSSS
jgi:hypothetical protein